MIDACAKDLELDVKNFLDGFPDKPEPVVEFRSRLDFLNKSVELTTQSRNKEYGSFDANMIVFAELLTTYCRARKIIGPDQKIESWDASYFLGLTKIARIMMGASIHPDNNVDLNNYNSEGGWLEYANAHNLPLDL